MYRGRSFRRKHERSDERIRDGKMHKFLHLILLGFDPSLSLGFGFNTLIR